MRTSRNILQVLLGVLLIGLFVVPSTMDAQVIRKEIPLWTGKAFTNSGTALALAGTAVTADSVRDIPIFVTDASSAKAPFSLVAYQLADSIRLEWYGIGPTGGTDSIGVTFTLYAKYGPAANYLSRTLLDSIKAQANGQHTVTASIYGNGSYTYIGVTANVSVAGAKTNSTTLANALYARLVLFFKPPGHD
jgi:hypothetical protein